MIHFPSNFLCSLIKNRTELWSCQAMFFLSMPSMVSPRL